MKINSVKKCIAVFPGVGTQYIGMGKALCEEFQEASDIFAKANEILKFDLKKMCTEGRLSVLSKYENAQVAILTISYIMYKIYLKNNNIIPVLGVGHSLGEISALLCSGSMDLSEALLLTQQRGQIMSHVNGKNMLVENVDEYELKRIISGFKKQDSRIYLACQNTPTQYMISCSDDIFDEFGNYISDYGIKVNSLFNSRPVHCNMLKSASEDFMAAQKKIVYQKTRFPVYSNYTADIYENSSEIAMNLKKQMYHKVRWWEIVQKIRRTDYDFIIEVGPRTVLRDMLKSNDNTIPIISLDDPRDIEIFQSEFLKKYNRKELNSEFVKACIKYSVTLRNRNNDYKDYEKNAIFPYKELRNLFEEHSRNDIEYDEQEIQKAFELFTQILKGKSVPESIKDKMIVKIKSIRRVINQ